MRIVLATDAWEPQVNGVVRTLTRTVAECRAMGHEVEVIEPSLFKTIPCPTYPEIRLALGAEEEIREMLRPHLEPAALPRRVLVVPELPMRGPGKPDRAAVARLLGG